jgi:glucosamine-6-phosphate deaminase
MEENLFRHVNIPRHRIHIPDGLAPEVPEYCQQYEGAIRAAGGIDIQILGIGVDGHIGFNEPTSSLASRTRIKTLSEQTRGDNARHFGDIGEVPHHVITMGVGTIMESRMCLLLAFGEKKAQAVAQMVEGPVTSMVPGSILQMHPQAKVFLDEAASSKLEKRDYYRWVFDHKPDWQRF